MDALKSRTRLTCRLLSAFIAFTFSFTSILPPAYAQSIGALNLPAPGAVVSVTTGFTPVHISGITINPENPLQFDFIINTGDTNLKGEELKAESEKLIKYFLASLTVPEEELWVNLSPYEKDRIVAKGFGDTMMGQDMLAQDYILKQLTASMMYPEKELGKKFWDRVYQKAYERYGSTEIPMNTFNKIWIVPDEAIVYQQGLSAFVIKRRLKVMLEEDYLALQKNLTNHASESVKGIKADAKVASGISSEIVREILIPEIEKEVNEGKTFANLRQIYNSLILATWYKTNLKESLLGQIYVNQNKTKGIDTQDKQANEKIYKQYVESFKKGVYNYIREDHGPVTQELIPRKYFSGGVNAVYNPVKKLFLSAIISVGLLTGAPSGPAKAEVLNVLNDPDQVLVTARMAEKKEEAAVITLKAGEQLSSPNLVVDGASVDLGNAVIAGDVRIDNRSGQPVVLGREAREFFPKTEDGRLIIQDTHMTIVASAEEAQKLASSPITQKGKSGSILRNIVLAVALGTMTCFGGGCGKPPHQPVVEVPSDQDMSIKSIEQLRVLLKDPSWPIQRNAAVEIYNRFERKVSGVTANDVELARSLLVIPRIPALTSPDSATTTNSAEYKQLLELGAIAKDPLKQQLERENANINTRQWSEQLLEEIIDDVLKQYDEILPSLRTVLKDPNSAIYDFAVGKVQSLIYRHPLALSTGIALLKDPVAGVRIAAANALADLGFESAIIPLGNARTLELDAKVIAALDNATNVLLQIADMTSWPLEDLKAALTSPYWSIQRIAIQLVMDRGSQGDKALAVAQIQKKIVLLTSPDENTRNTSPYIHLLELGTDAIAPLRANVENTAADIEGVVSTDPDIVFAQKRVIALITDGRDMGLWSEADLSAALTDPSPVLMRNALGEALQRTMVVADVKAATEQIVRNKMAGLVDYQMDVINNNPDYRFLQSLGGVIEPLIVAHIHDTTVNYNSRRWMTILLGQVGAFNTAFPVFESVLDNANNAYGPWVKYIAEQGLKELFERQSITVVTSFLQNVSDSVQIAAAEALAAKGDTAALPALQAVAVDTTESPEVINAVQEAIAQISAVSSPVIVTSSPLTGRVEEKKVGGIDFNPALLNLQIKRDSRGVPLPLSQQPVNSIHIDGLIPIIINITPVPNLPMLLGLIDTKGGEGLGYGQSLGPIEYQGKSKTREPEEFSRLY